MALYYHYLTVSLTLFSLGSRDADQSPNHTQPPVKRVRVMPLYYHYLIVSLTLFSLAGGADSHPAPVKRVSHAPLLSLSNSVLDLVIYRLVVLTHTQPPAKRVRVMPLYYHYLTVSLTLLSIGWWC